MKNSETIQVVKEHLMKDELGEALRFAIQNLEPKYFPIKQKLNEGGGAIIKS